MVVASTVTAIGDTLVTDQQTVPFWLYAKAERYWFTPGDVGSYKLATKTAVDGAV